MIVQGITELALAVWGGVLLGIKLTVALLVIAYILSPGLKNWLKIASLKQAIRKTPMGPGAQAH